MKLQVCFSYQYDIHPRNKLWTTAHVEWMWHRYVRKYHIGYDRMHYPRPIVVMKNTTLIQNAIWFCDIYNPVVNEFDIIHIMTRHEISDAQNQIFSILDIPFSRREILTGCVVPG